MLDFTVIVVTHNRAAILRETLTALRALSGRASWELLVVDNGSTDATRDVVAAAGGDFPVPLRYQYEPAPGRYAALNHGIRAARGRFVANTDDDAFPREDWLDRALDGLMRFDCGFVGGPVFPVWGGAIPDWLDDLLADGARGRNALPGKVLALQDYGPVTREYGKSIGWPLGVNIAYRPDVFERAGFFDGRLGRVAGTLRNQAQREWHLRARAAGVSGVYLPEMVVHHRVSRDRLNKQYFRRWFFWHGVSRTIMHHVTGLDIVDPDTAGAAPAGERHVAAVPLSVWRRMALSAASWLRRIARGDATAAFEYELWLAFCAGIVWHRWHGGRRFSGVPPSQGEGAPGEVRGGHACAPN
jgi:glycosyltransferase involved in cell wall biosynthesis